MNLKIINLDLLLNIKMLKRKTILVFFILLIIFQIGFFVSSGDPPQEDPELTLIQQLDALKNEGNLDYVISEDEEFITLFLNEGDFEFGENSVENLVSTESYSRSTVKMDMSGNVIAASLYNEAKAKQIINGNEFEVPEDGYLEYGEDVYELASRTKINNLSSGSTIIGNDIDFFGEFLLGGKNEGNNKCYFSNSGYFLESGSAIYNGIEINPTWGEGVLIVTNPSFDLSNYKEAWIKKTEDSLKIQSYESGKNVYIRFLEGNGFVDLNSENLDGNKEKILSMNLGGGDSAEIFKNSDILEGLPPRIIHESGNGFTTIENGRHIFEFLGNEFNADFGNLNTKNLEATSLDIISDVLPGKILSVDGNSRYIITDFEAGNILTFDTSPNTILSKSFDSLEGEKLYNFAEGELGDSAFRWGGRGNVCYTLKNGKYVQEKIPTNVKGYDCIGFPITGLIKAVYPGSSLKDFPPNLKLVESLDKKGWNNQIIEPTSVIGERKTTEAVKNIPAGSIVFLMHAIEKTPYGTEGVDYIKHINEKSEKINLLVGHTLIRGKGEDNFLNAVPGYYPNLIPLKAREFNEQLALEGKPEFFQGAVKEGNLIPENDYLFVVTPPKD